MYTLIIEDRHGRSAAEISFDQGSYTIGRVDGSDVVLPSNSVSRIHARVTVSNGKCYIEDLGSANGVFVDGTMIREKTEIKNGSKMRIGEYTLYLEYKDQSDINAGQQDVLKTQIVSSGQSGYKIVRVGDNFAGEEFMLSEAENTIGRTDDNYILLSDISISRNHAKIVNKNLNFSVIDLNSSNGTFVNNKRINSACPIIPGSLIRFGNVSFVFVPNSQRVDLNAYANVGQKQNENRVALTIIIVLVIVILLVFISIIYYISKNSDSVVDEETAETIAAEENKAKFQSALDDAQNLFKNQHYDTSLEKVEILLIENPKSKAALELKEKLKFEIKIKDKIDNAKLDIESRDFEKAIKALETVSDSSEQYAKAQTLIKDTKSRIRVGNYNDAKQKFEEDINLKSVRLMCDTAQELDPEAEHEREKIEYTAQQMERISNKKSNYQTTAKKCAKSLKMMLE